MDTMQGHSGEHGHECGECHGHGMMGDMCGHRHWRHIIIKVLVALFIFWCGVQFGELKATAEWYLSGYSGYDMMGWYQGNQEYYRSPAMMYGTTYSTPNEGPARLMMGTTTPR